MCLRLVVVVWLIATSACVSIDVTRPSATEVEFVTAEQAAALPGTWVPLEIPFGEGQDGTALVMQFLEQASARGARHATDLEIHLVDGGATPPAVCVTRATPQLRTRTETETVMRPGGVQPRSELVPVTQWVTESRHHCQLVTKPVQRMETTYQSLYDSVQKRSRSVPITRMVTRYETQNECTYRPETKMVTRYEWQFRNQYAPPRWETITRERAEWEMVESPPVCRMVDAGEAPPGNRLVGRILLPAIPTP